MTTAGSSRDIGSLNEKHLHASLKEWYAGPDDLVEVPVDGFLVDIVQDDYLVEIQTRNLGAMKRKLTLLLPDYRIKLIHPIAQEKWIVKQTATRKETRRKSPKRGVVEDVFHELVSIPQIAMHENFSLLVTLIQEEEVRLHKPGRSWRRKGWVTEERRLVKVVDQILFETPKDWLQFLPTTLPESFTTAVLAEETGHPRARIQKMVYCLREMGLIDHIGTKDRYKLYARADR